MVASFVKWIGMLKLLLFGLLAWAFVLVLRSKLAKTSSPDQHASPAEEQVVPCAHCGIHVPASQAIKHHEHTFCCQQHLDDHDVANI